MSNDTVTGTIVHHVPMTSEMLVNFQLVYSKWLSLLSALGYGGPKGRARLQRLLDWHSNTRRRKRHAELERRRNASRCRITIVRETVFGEAPGEVPFIRLAATKPAP